MCWEASVVLERVPANGGERGVGKMWVGQIPGAQGWVVVGQIQAAQGWAAPTLAVQARRQICMMVWSEVLSERQGNCIFP
jgi:hypothetical protein